MLATAPRLTPFGWMPGTQLPLGATGVRRRRVPRSLRPGVVAGRPRDATGASRGRCRVDLGTRSTTKMKARLVVLPRVWITGLLETLRSAPRTQAGAVGRRTLGPPAPPDGSASPSRQASPGRSRVVERAPPVVSRAVERAPRAAAGSPGRSRVSAPPPASVPRCRSQDSSRGARSVRAPRGRARSPGRNRNSPQYLPCGGADQRKCPLNCSYWAFRVRPGVVNTAQSGARLGHV